MYETVRQQIMKAWVGRCAKEFRPPPEDGKKSMKAVQEVTRPELYTIRSRLSYTFSLGSWHEGSKGKGRKSWYDPRFTGAV